MCTGSIGHCINACIYLCICHAYLLAYSLGCVWRTGHFFQICIWTTSINRGSDISKNMWICTVSTVLRQACIEWYCGRRWGRGVTWETRYSATCYPAVDIVNYRWLYCILLCVYIFFLCVFINASVFKMYLYIKWWALKRSVEKMCKMCWVFFPFMTFLK